MVACFSLRCFFASIDSCVHNQTEGAQAQTTFFPAIFGRTNPHLALVFQSKSPNASLSLSFASSDYFFAEERLKILAEQEALATQKKRAEELSVCPSCSGEIVAPSTTSAAASMSAPKAPGDDGLSSASSGGDGGKKPRYVSSSSVASRTDSNVTMTSGSRSTSGNSSSASGDDDEASSNKSSSASTSTGSGGKQLGRSSSVSTSNSKSSDEASGTTAGNGRKRKRKLCTCESSLCGTAETSTATTNTNASSPKKRCGKKKPHGMISFQDLNKEISRRWKLVDPADLARYKEMSKEDTARFRREMKEYQEEQGIAMGLIEEKTTASGVAYPTDQASRMTIPNINANNGQQGLQPQVPNSGINGMPSSTTAVRPMETNMQQMILQKQQAPLPQQQLQASQGSSTMMMGNQQSSNSVNDNSNAIIALLLQQLTCAQKGQGTNPQEQTIHDLLVQYLRRQIAEHQAPAPGPVPAPAVQASVAFMAPSPAQATPPAPMMLSSGPAYPPNGPAQQHLASQANILGQLQTQLQRQQSSMSGSSSSSIAGYSASSAMSSPAAAAAAAVGGLLAPGSASVAALAEYGLQQLRVQLQRQQQQPVPSNIAMPPPPPKPQQGISGTSPQLLSSNSIFGGVSATGGLGQFTASTGYLQQVLDSAKQTSSMSSAGSSANSSQGDDDGDAEINGQSAAKKRKGKSGQKKVDFSHLPAAAKAKKPKASDSSSAYSFSSMSTLATFKGQVEASQQDSPSGPITQKAETTFPSEMSSVSASSSDNGSDK